MDDRQLIEDLLSALEYHTEQTRPIEFSKVAIEAAREYLRKPAQRPWVGLTEEEIMVIGDKVANEKLVGLVSNFRGRLARAIEQTLKERNHG